LLDYQLPDLDGLEFLAALTGEDGTISIPVIMLTGHGSEAIVVKAMRAGAADYLPKGVLSVQSLGRAVTNAVVEYKLRAAIEQQCRILEQTNQELRRKTEEIQRFYHMLSHELKTPLTAAREFVSIVLDGLAGPLSEEQREYLGYVKDSCDQMTLGLNDLLDTTRLDTGKLRISPSPASIGSVVSRTVATVVPAAQDKGIRVQQVIAPDLPDLLIDEKRITQVLANLLSNALKFTPEGRQIVVRANTDPQRPSWVLVSVSDTGRGIESEQLDYIFDRLYQARSDDAMLEGGLGLGLHICREVVSLHGGEIWVESTLGKGSTFYFTLPQHSACEEEGVRKEVSLCKKEVSLCKKSSS
jgi:signal transduction histidine kinase